MSRCQSRFKFGKISGCFSNIRDYYSVLHIQRRHNATQTYFFSQGNLVPAAPIGQQRERRPAAEPPAEHSAPDELRTGELEQRRPGRAVCRFESQPAATAGGEAVHQQGVEELVEK